MIRRYKNRLTIAAGVFLTLLIALPSFGAEAVLEAKVLEKMSKEADTPEEHARVAKQYRLRAESLEKRAQEHEEEAEKLRAKPRSAMAVKWPSMVRSGADREMRLAMEARRAARECYARADRHVQLAVEGQLAE